MSHQRRSRTGLASEWFLRMWCKMLTHERGASAVEYALLIAGIAAVIILAVTFVGQTVSAQFSEVGSSIANTG